MGRTSVLPPDETRDRLRRLAADRGVSMATIIREAIEAHVASAHPGPRSIGSGASGISDTARRSAVGRPEARAWR